MTAAGRFPIAEGGMPPPSFELAARVGAERHASAQAGWLAPLNVQFARPNRRGARSVGAKISLAQQVSRSASSGKELIGNPWRGAKACAYHNTRSTLWRATPRDDDH